MLHDKDIREPLFDFLEEWLGKIRIIEEKQISKSRADVMVITENSFIGIEIKSDADTYVRLEKQVKFYDQYFDYNMVVVGSSHGHHITEHVPEHWGIITVEEVDGKLDFYIMREMGFRSKYLAAKYKRQVGLLWRMELAKLQENNNLPAYKQKSKAFVRDKLLEKIPYEELKPQMCELLFERDYSTVSEKIAEYKKENDNKKII